MVTKGTRHPPSRILRPAIASNHFIHWTSSLIVLGIAAYFIDKYSSGQHLIYWITIAAIDAFLYIPSMAFSFVRSYKGYLFPLAWIFSYLWLTSFIFAAQDYSWHHCELHSPPQVGHCTLKKTLEAFAFLAFFTNILGLVLEGLLWDKQRFKPGDRPSGVEDGHDKFVHPSGDTAATA